MFKQFRERHILWATRALTVYTCENYSKAYIYMRPEGPVRPTPLLALSRVVICECSQKFSLFQREEHDFEVSQQCDARFQKFLTWIQIETSYVTLVTSHENCKEVSMWKCVFCKYHFRWHFWKLGQNRLVLSHSVSLISKFQQIKELCPLSSFSLFYFKYRKDWGKLFEKSSSICLIFCCF